MKKTPELGESTEFFDNALAEDLQVIKDDIVTAEKSKKEEKDYTQQPYALGSNIPRSQPTEKFYIETDSKLDFFYSFIDLFEIRKKDHNHRISKNMYIIYIG